MLLDMSATYLNLAFPVNSNTSEYGLTRRDPGQLARPASAPGPHMFTAYPDFHEEADYGDVISEADRKRMRQELEMHYRIRREQMFKQMQLAFRQKQLEVEKRAPKDGKKKKKSKKGKEKREKKSMWKWGDSFDTSSQEEDSSGEDASDTESEDDWKKAVVSPWNHNANFDELRAARAKVDVVICTTDHGEIMLTLLRTLYQANTDRIAFPFIVPGYRIVEKLGTFKVVVPRS